MGYTLRVIWACMKKDIKSSLTERAFTIVGLLVPLNVLIMLSLFVVGGGMAPTAVVMNDRGPYAQQFYQAMSGAHSFILQQTSLQEADAELHAGQIVAVVTVPAEFDQRIQHNQSVQIGVQINNLNTDLPMTFGAQFPWRLPAFTRKPFPISSRLGREREMPILLIPTIFHICQYLFLLWDYVRGDSTVWYWGGS